MTIDVSDITEYLAEIQNNDKALFAVAEGMRVGTEELRARLGINLSGRILNVITGRLRASALIGIEKPLISKNKVTLRYGSNVVYAPIHEFGGKAGRGKKVTIPQRRPFTISGEESLSKMTALVGVHLIKFLKQDE